MAPQESASPSNAATGSPGEVLVLYSVRSSWPISDDWALGIRQGLMDSLGRVPRINNEYLDLTRFQDDQTTQQLVDLIRSKCVDSNIRIVVSFDLALPFAKNHLRELFPEAVFLSAVVEPRLTWKPPKIRSRPP